MSEFTLPSGRVIELPAEPTYGQVVDALDYARASGHDSALYHYYVGLIAAMSGMSPAEVLALPFRDGIAMRNEVIKREEGRPAEEEAPFEPASTPTS